MAKAMDVATYLIQLRDADEENGRYFSLSNLKLQKLLYYCQGGHYMWDDEELIDDGYFEAWDYGPVIAEVYRNFKKFGQNDIYSEADDINLTDAEKDTIAAVWEQLKEKHAFDLVKSTHEESPWMNARENDRVYISNPDIIEFFTAKEGDS